MNLYSILPQEKKKGGSEELLEIFEGECLISGW